MLYLSFQLMLLSMFLSFFALMRRLSHPFPDVSSYQPCQEEEQKDLYISLSQKNKGATLLMGTGIAGLMLTLNLRSRLLLFLKQLKNILIFLLGRVLQFILWKTYIWVIRSNHHAVSTHLRWCRTWQHWGMKAFALKRSFTAESLPIPYWIIAVASRWSLLDLNRGNMGKTQELGGLCMGASPQ